MPTPRLTLSLSFNLTFGLVGFKCSGSIGDVFYCHPSSFGGRVSGCRGYGRNWFDQVGSAVIVSYVGLCVCSLESFPIISFFCSS